MLESGSHSSSSNLPSILGVNAIRRGSAMANAEENGCAAGPAVCCVVAWVAGGGVAV